MSGLQELEHDVENRRVIGSIVSYYSRYWNGSVFGDLRYHDRLVPSSDIWQMNS